MRKKFIFGIIAALAGMLFVGILIWLNYAPKFDHPYEELQGMELIRYVEDMPDATRIVIDSKTEIERIYQIIEKSRLIKVDRFADENWWGESYQEWILCLDYGEEKEWWYQRPSGWLKEIRDKKGCFQGYLMIDDRMLDEEINKIIESNPAIASDQCLTETTEAEPEEEDRSEWFVTALAEGRKSADTADSDEAEEAIPDPKTEYEKIYAPVIAEMQDVLRYGYKESERYQYVPGFAQRSDGTLDPLTYKLTRLDIDNIAYTYMDINEDEIPELLIGVLRENYTLSEDSQKKILGGYTIIDGAISRFLDGADCWDYYKWMGDGKICYSEYRVGYHECSLAVDGTGLIPENSYCHNWTSEKGVSFSYAGISGKEEEITEDDWNNATEELRDRVQDATELPYQLFFTDVQNLTGRWQTDEGQESVEFQFFRDGTWMAMGIKESDLITNADNLFGTCEQEEDGAYRLYYQDDTGLCRIETVVDAYGNESFDFAGHTFYKDEDALTPRNVLDSPFGFMMSSDGICIDFSDDGTCYVWDDRENIRLAHWGIETDEGRIRIRIQSITEDDKCDMLVNGIFDTDPTGREFFMIQKILGVLGNPSQSSVIMWDESKG